MKFYIAIIPKIGLHLLKGLSQGLLFPNKLQQILLLTLCCHPALLGTAQVKTRKAIIKKKKLIKFSEYGRNGQCGQWRSVLGEF